MSSKSTYNGTTPIFSSPKHPNLDELILRVTLAIDRTRLANQCSFLSFVQTGIYFISTALGIFHLDEKGGLNWLAWAFVDIGVASIIRN